MVDVNIFGNIDATGLLKDFKSQIDDYYGGDPTVQSPAQGVLDKIVDPNFAPLQLGYWDHNVIPNYTRLVSSKDSTIGYEIRSGDTVQRDGKTYLTTAYNLSIVANNGDTLRWWGHTIVPNIATQAIISSVNKPGPSTDPPPEFTNMTNTNITFYNTAGAVDPGNLMHGLNIETRGAFCITCTLSGNVGHTVNYDIDVMLMSAPLVRHGSLLTFPIVKVVVDPTVLIEG